MCASRAQGLADPPIRELSSRWVRPRKGVGGGLPSGLYACQRKPLTGHHNTQATTNKFNRHVETYQEREGEIEQKTKGRRALGPPPALKEDCTPSVLGTRGAAGGARALPPQ